VRKIITPVGRALFPALNPGFPDTTFDPVYQVLLCGKPEEFGDFIKHIQATHRKGIDEQQAIIVNSGGEKKVKVHDLPNVEDIKDKDGNLTGEIALKCKLKAEGTRKDGSPYTNDLMLFDSQGHPYSGKDEIGNGSKLKVGVYPKTWFVPTLGVGLTLEIGAVFIIDLISKSGRAETAEDWGFEKEDGFVAPKSTSEKVVEAFGGAEEEQGEHAFDF